MSRHGACAAAAPGKLFLFGEYAVLCGGWSIVAASSRRVRVRFDPASERSSYEVRGAPLSSDTALPRAALKALGLPETQLKRLSADLSELYLEGEKLGLGSSAASTIATMLSLSPSLLKEPERLFSLAFQAHRELQQGRGSGADIAASAFGGLIGYRLGAPQPPFELLGVPTLDVPALDMLRRRESPYADVIPSLSWPATLRVEAIWIGQPASSTALVARVEQAFERSPGRVKAELERLASLAAQALKLCVSREATDASRFKALAASCEEAMHALTALSGAPIVTSLHEQLSSVALRRGFSTKPSGAGGGDFSLVFGGVEDPWEALLAELPAGCRHVPFRLGASYPEVLAQAF